MVFLSNLVNGISLGSIYAIIALGYTMVYGIAKMLNFAHGDVIMVGAYIVFCAMPSAEQLEYAEEQGVELALVPIGREAFVFIVNKNNPVDNLTSKQVRDIYSGKIKKWSEVGGGAGGEGGAGAAGGGF